MGSGLEYRKDVRIRITQPVPGLLGCMVNGSSFIVSRKYWDGPVWLCPDILASLSNPLVKAQRAIALHVLVVYESTGNPDEVCPWMRLRM